MKYSRKKLCIIDKIKCQQNLRKFNKITVEKVNEVLKKRFLHAKDVCTIYSENYN